MLYLQRHGDTLIQKRAVALQDLATNPRTPALGAVALATTGDDAKEKLLNAGLGYVGTKMLVDMINNGQLQQNPMTPTQPPAPAQNAPNVTKTTHLVVHDGNMYQYRVVDPAKGIVEVTNLQGVPITNKQIVDGVIKSAESNNVIVQNSLQEAIVSKGGNQQYPVKLYQTANGKDIIVDPNTGSVLNYDATTQTFTPRQNIQGLHVGNQPQQPQPQPQQPQQPQFPKGRAYQAATEVYINKANNSPVYFVPNSDGKGGTFYSVDGRIIDPKSLSKEIANRTGGKNVQKFTNFKIYDVAKTPVIELPPTQQGGKSTFLHAENFGQITPELEQKVITRKNLDLSGADDVIVDGKKFFRSTNAQGQPSFYDENMNPVTNQNLQSRIENVHNITRQGREITLPNGQKVFEYNSQYYHNTGDPLKPHEVKQVKIHQANTGKSYDIGGKKYVETIGNTKNEFARLGDDGYYAPLKDGKGFWDQITRRRIELRQGAGTTKPVRFEIPRAFIKAHPRISAGIGAGLLGAVGLYYALKPKKSKLEKIQEGIKEIEKKIDNARRANAGLKELQELQIQLEELLKQQSDMKQKRLIDSIPIGSNWATPNNKQVILNNNDIRYQRK